MRLGIEATPILGDRGGVGWYLYYLLRSFVRLRDDYELFCYVEPGYRDKIRWESWMDDPRLRWREATRKTMRWCGANDRLDLFHGPNFRLRTEGRYGGIVTIHDLWMDRHPEYSPKLFPHTSSNHTRHAAWQARRVITDSYASAREINELYGLPMDRMVVVHCGIAEDFYPVTDPEVWTRVRERIGIGSEGFVLFVGGADPRKNHRVFLEAVAQMRAGLGRRKVVLIGDAVHRHGNYHETAARLGLTDITICPGRVPMDDLRVLYSRADLFAFPSLYEGFGMPVLEAMACGAPVVTSNRSSLLEVAGTAAVLVDPENSQQVAEGMVAVLDQPARREELRRQGFERVHRFSWDRAATQVMRVYRETCHSNAAVSARGGTRLDRQVPHNGNLQLTPDRLKGKPKPSNRVQVGGTSIRPTSLTNVLVIKLRYVGDVLLSTAVPRALKAAYPGIRVTMAVMKGTEAVLLGNPAVDEILVVDRHTLRTQAEFFQEIRRQQFDGVVDLTGNDRSELACALSGAAVRVGFRESRRWRARLAYTHERNTPDSLGQGAKFGEVQTLHRMERDLSVLRAIGLDPAAERPQLFFSAEEEAHAEQLMQTLCAGESSTPVVMLHPGARYWFKAWPPERFAELADRLMETCGCLVLLGGGAAEQPIGCAIEQIARGRIVNLIGTIGLREYAALVKRCALFIGNDNGAMHIAAAVGTPVVGLFGPSDPAEWAPLGPYTQICYKGVDCRPCFHPTCRRGEQNCMRQIGIDEVFAAAKTLLVSVPMKQVPSERSV
ncbi:MAG: lipopolysaccharide heptosyltransferase II [Nitrospiraceae bacterium]